MATGASIIELHAVPDYKMIDELAWTPDVDRGMLLRSASAGASTAREALSTAREAFGAAAIQHTAP